MQTPSASSFSFGSSPTSSFQSCPAFGLSTEDAVNPQRPSSTMSSSSNKMSLKLLIDATAGRVLFAEASKDFIDFLFNLLRLPLGTVTRLLTENDMLGSVGKLYKSIENLSDDYLLNPQKDKNLLLKPAGPVSGYLLPANDGHGDPIPIFSDLYTCSNCRMNYVTEVAGTSCPNCHYNMERAVQYVGKRVSEMTGSSGDGGFVKGVVTYMVMDDLEVQPMSTISCFTLLNKFNIKDVSTLQERVVELGIEEGIKLLKASLQSNHVLTSAFLYNVRD